MQRLGRIAAILSGLVAALAVVAPEATPATPTLISVNPASGVPGQAVTVRGRGFCAAARCSRVRIEVYGVTVAQNVRVSPNGTFSRRLRVPGGATGEVGVIAVQELANGAELRALANFEYVIRRPPTKSKSQTTRAKSKSRNGVKSGGRTGPSEAPRPRKTTPTAETTPVPDRRSPPPVAKTAPKETKQTSTNTNGNRRAAPPLTEEDRDDFPVGWAMLAGACIAGAVIALFALRTRRRQRASAR